jgi:hypothetical protein
MNEFTAKVTGVRVPGVEPGGLAPSIDAAALSTGKAAPLPAGADPAGDPAGALDAGAAAALDAGAAAALVAGAAAALDGAAAGALAADGDAVLELELDEQAAKTTTATLAKAAVHARVFLTIPGLL